MSAEDRAARVGVVTASDRASAGQYKDESGPAIEAYLSRALSSAFTIERRIIPDGFESVRDCLVDLVDNVGCDLILTTGGTGPSERDLTPEATLAAAPRLYPGFGELMRQESLRDVPTAILSRQVAAQRGRCLIINLPGKPNSIKTCLDAVFAAVPYCLDLIGAARLETDPAVIKAFRPAPVTKQAGEHSSTEDRWARRRTHTRGPQALKVQRPALIRRWWRLLTRRAS